jgi:hypothetical protein
MQAALTAVPYQGLRRTAPEFYLPLPAVYAGLQYKGPAWLSVAWDAEAREEIHALRRFFQLPIDLLIGAAPEYMREILALEPALCTFANLQRGDSCFDLLLFHDQVRELLASFPVPSATLKVRLEPEPDQVRAAGKLGFSTVEFDISGLLGGKVTRDRFLEACRTAEKFNLRTAFGAEASLPQLQWLLQVKAPDVLIVGMPFYHMALREGTDRAFDSIRSLFGR